jgi:ABC-type glycerol-3-phosphate transport system substrate-binding protein
MSGARLGALALALAAALVAGSAAARAQTPTAGTAPTAAPSVGDVKPYEVEGFRSAKFGMDEAAVKRAIAADFNIKESAIAREINPIDRTTVLSITAKDVLPDIAVARVHYILGYTQKKLFQIVLTWGAGTSETAPGNTSVLGGAQELLSYFVGQSFKPEDRIVNAQTPDGNALLFQGTDEKGRVVQLQYGTVAETPKKGETTDDAKAPARLPYGRLVYVEDPKNLDIFKIKPGQF